MVAQAGVRLGVNANTLGCLVNRLLRLAVGGLACTGHPTQRNRPAPLFFFFFFFFFFFCCRRAVLDPARGAVGDGEGHNPHAQALTVQVITGQDRAVHDPVGNPFLQPHQPVGVDDRVRDRADQGGIEVAASVGRSPLWRSAPPWFRLSCCALLLWLFALGGDCLGFVVVEAGVMDYPCFVCVAGAECWIRICNTPASKAGMAADHCRGT